MDDTSAARWLTYRELATEAGLSLPAAEARARRLVKGGRWRHRIDNNPPNAARVLVPVADLEAIRGQGAAGVAQPRAPGAPLGGTQEVAQSPTVNDLLAELKASHEQVAGELRHRADAAEARIRELAAELGIEQEALARERERADRAEATAAAVPELRERAARAEGESGALREQVAAERERAEARARDLEAARAELAAWTAGGPGVAGLSEPARASVRPSLQQCREAAEGEARGLRLALEKARQPFWRRWLG
jgi:hypothetical protein